MNKGNHTKPNTKTKKNTKTLADRLRALDIGKRGRVAQADVA